MTTLNGFLNQDFDEDNPTMTKGQKEFLLKGCKALYENSCHESIAKLMTNIIEELLVEIPDSRACVCCDMYSEGHCIAWNSKIPTEAIAKGCHRFQDFGAPF